MDECLLLILLVIQSGSTLPIVLFSSIEMGAMFLSTFLISAAVSVLLAFVNTFERCCSWVHCMNGCGITFFYLIELCVIGLSIYGIYYFALPFFEGGSFLSQCQEHHLDDSTSRTGCSSLPGTQQDPLVVSLFIIRQDTFLCQ